jgi:hypothetical protein
VEATAVAIERGPCGSSTGAFDQATDVDPPPDGPLCRALTFQIRTVQTGAPRW